VKRILLAAALALVLGAGPARAESPRSGSFELRLSWYRPDIDSEFHGTAHPYADAFGSSNAIMFQLAFAKSMWITEVGTLDIGLGAGYWERYGVGVTSTGATGDRTTLKMVPLQLFVGYRVDYLFDRLGIPLAPYARAALVDHFWWVNDGSGNTASWPNPAGGTSSGSGQTFGYAFTGGVALVLDFFDSQLAREMDNDSGINHTLLYADVTKGVIDDFGSKKSWNLSGAGLVFSAGLQFVF
jgi:hypothetical protein